MFGGGTRPECTVCSSPQAPVRIWLNVVCVLILLMVCVGGITRLTGAGLSMTDWKPILGSVPPLNHEDWLERFAQYQATPQYRLLNEEMTLPGFKFIFFWEYIHRLLGRVVGVVFAVPFLIFLFQRRIWGAHAAKLAMGFLLGGAQGVLGWYMVRSGLVDQPYVSHLRLAAHLGLALFLFGFLLWVRLDLNPRRPPLTGVPRFPALRIGALVFLGVFVIQVLYGAFVAGLKAGYAFNTFPKMLGHWIPPGLWEMESAVANLLHNPTLVQFLHRTLGWILFAIAVAIALLALSVWVPRQTRMLAFGMAGFTLLQFILGVLTLVLAVPLGMAVMHQFTACVLLGILVWLLHDLAELCSIKHSAPDPVAGQPGELHH